MNHLQLPSFECLHDCLSYDDNTGYLYHKIKPRHYFKSDRAYKISASKINNKPILNCFNGYVKVYLFSKSYFAHRLIWKMKTGNDPINEIDHKDLNKSNNIFSNLREAISTENNRNVGKRIDNKTGFKGVHFEKSKGRFQAKIRIGNNKRKFLGYFDTAEAASEAYRKASLEFHKEFSKFTNPS